MVSIEGPARHLGPHPSRFLGSPRKFLRRGTFKKRLRVFQSDLLDPHRFLVTLELVPGRESFGQSLDTVKGIAADAFSDGRVSAVSVTDNPGGNPALSPDAIGHEVFSVGMDVVVHFACRDRACRLPAGLCSGHGMHSRLTAPQKPSKKV